MSQPLIDQDAVVLSVALSPTVPAWVTQHYCAGLGPFGRSAGIYAATPAQAEQLQANPMLHVVVADLPRKDSDQLGSEHVADASGLTRKVSETPTSAFDAKQLPLPTPARKKRL